VNSITWNVGNQITAVTFGSLDNDSYQYDPNTGRMIQYQFNMGSGPQSQTGALTWNANGTLKQLQITDQINSANSQTCTYGYDDLTRITGANCGAVWSQTFSLDSFGNLKKSGSASFPPTYTGDTGTGVLPSNQYYQISGGSAGASNYYDANGNLKNDVTHTYTWDADGNMLSTDGTTVTMMYDALDRMIEQTRGASHTEIVYGPYGMKVALMNGASLVKAFVKLPGGSRAVYGSSGLAYYRHADHLGSSRLATTPTRTKQYDVAYAPYGEDYNGSGTQDLAFTDENQDTVAGGWSTNLYDFMLREYRSAHGRWTSPDPSGLGAVDPTNPQTWNRYAYLMNDPMALVDLFGDGCYDANGFYWATAGDALCNGMASSGWSWINTNGGVSVTQGAGGSLAYAGPNGEILSPSDAAELGLTGLPTSPVLPTWAQCPECHAGCTGPGIPCTLAPLRTGDLGAISPGLAGRTFTYQVKDVNGNAVRGISEVAEYFTDGSGMIPTPGKWLAGYGLPNVSPNGTFIDGVGETLGFGSWSANQYFSAMVNGTNYVISTWNVLSVQSVANAVLVNRRTFP
jgi:RHS repeat-associated protein